MKPALRRLDLTLKAETMSAMVQTRGIIRTSRKNTLTEEGKKGRNGQ